MAGVTPRKIRGPLSGAPGQADGTAWAVAQKNIPSTNAGKTLMGDLSFRQKTPFEWIAAIEAEAAAKARTAALAGLREAAEGWEVAARASDHMSIDGGPEFASGLRYAVDRLLALIDAAVGTTPAEGGEPEGRDEDEGR